MKALDTHRLHDKHFLTLERELRRLYKAQWNAPAIPLERPYQKGCYKTYRLREDAVKHPDTALFQRVLPVVNQVVVSVRGDFRSRQGKALELGTKVLRHRDWYRLSWPQSIQRLFSYGRWLEMPAVDSVWCPEPGWVWGFKLTRDWWLEEAIFPRLITHQRVDLPEVKARIAEIEAKLRHTNGFHRLDWLHGKRSHWHSWRGTPRGLCEEGLFDNESEDLPDL